MFINKQLKNKMFSKYIMVKKKNEEHAIIKPKEKVVRNDVSLRKEANKNTDFTCIKSSKVYNSNNEFRIVVILQITQLW